jgi:signal transduction histidine kinase
MKRLWLVICALVSTVTVLAQEPDSLVKQLAKLKTKNEAYVDLLNKVAQGYLITDPSESPSYINQAIRLADSLNYDHGIFQASINQGNLFWVSGLPDLAMGYFIRAITLSNEESGLDKARLYNSIGEVFKKKGKYDSALAYYFKGIKYAKDQFSDRYPSILAYNLGETYLLLGRTDSAYIYFSRSLDYATLDNNHRGRAYALYGLGMLTRKEGREKLALQYFGQSLKIRDRIDDKRGLIQSYLQLGEGFISTKNRDSSKYYFWKAHNLAEDIEANDLLLEVYAKMAEHHSTIGEYKTANYFLNAQLALKDSLHSRTFMDGIDRVKAALQTEIKEKEVQLQHERSLQQKSRNRILIATIFVVVIFIVVIGVIYSSYLRRRSEWKKQERERNAIRSLLDLTKKSSEESFDSLVKILFKQSLEITDSSRAELWVYSWTSNEASLQFSSSSQHDSSVSNGLCREIDHPDFFRLLQQERILSFGGHPFAHPPTPFTAAEMKMRRANYALVAPIYPEGKFFGFLVFEKAGNLGWSFTDQTYAASLADIIATAQSMHQNRLLEDQKELLIQQLVRRNQHLKEFAYVISHNLREPLAQVLGLYQLLEQRDDEKLDRRLLSEIGRSFKRMDEVVHDLSSLLHDEQKTRESAVKVELNSLLHEIVNEHQEELSLVGGTVEFDVDSPLILATNKAIFISVIHELLRNAIKFRNPDVPLKINILGSRNDDGVLLTISDNGRGLNLSKYGWKMFRMYNRFHQEVSGKGLGLFQLKNNLALIGGEITYTENPVRGISANILFQNPSGIPGQL